MTNILIIKTSSMGDIIHCLPIVADILQHNPTANVDWVVEESFADIVKCHPRVQTVIPVAIRRWRKQLFRQQTWREFSAFKHALQTTHYDVILDAQSLIKSAWLSTLAWGTRYGQNYQTAREPLAALIYQHTYHVPRQQHAVRQNRALAAKVFGYETPQTAPDYGITLPCVDFEVTLPANFVIAFHGTSRDSKLWPINHWVTLGQQLHLQGLSMLLPWGNQAEQQRAQTIAAQLPNAQVLPKANLTTMAHITAHAKAAIGVDTGLVHLAVALNIPTIAIYTDTFPALNGAYAGHQSLAVNLGGKGQLPNPAQVLETLASLLTPTH